jgi:selenide,water dikinase
VLDQLPKIEHERVLADFRGAEDAGVYILDDGTCLIQTLDFFTPIVDDPFDYGRIAAANALSDVYAMGGKPISALSIVAWSIEKLGHGPLVQVLNGAQEVCNSAGVPIIGGHSIDDREPKFGLVVIGTARQDELINNGGARPGDMLILTKPLGSGIYTTAMKQGKATDQMAKAVIAVMTRLNKDAAEAMQEAGVNAATDVTGYGLIGHLHEMMAASGVSAILTSSQVPTLPDLEDLALKGAVPGGTIANLNHTESYADWHESIGELRKFVLTDAQTSGGLLISCPPAQYPALKKAFDRRQMKPDVIGAVFDGPAGSVSVVP